METNNTKDMVSILTERLSKVKQHETKRRKVISEQLRLAMLHRKKTIAEQQLTANEKHERDVQRKFYGKQFDTFLLQLT